MWCHVLFSIFRCPTLLYLGLADSGCIQRIIQNKPPMMSMILVRIQNTNAYYYWYIYIYIYSTIIVLIYHDILILKYHHALHTWIWNYLYIIYIYIYTVLYTYTCYYGYTNTCCHWILPLMCIGTPLICPFSAVRGVVKTSTRWTKVSSFDETNRPKVFRPSVDMLRGFFKSWEIPNSPCFSFLNYPLVI